MRIVLSPSLSEAVDAVTTLLIDRIRSSPNLVIGLATGKTMEPVYAQFVNKVVGEKISLKECHFFMLDEYIGLSASNPLSFTSYLKDRLLMPLKLDQSQFHFPPVELSAPEGGLEYEKKIQSFGGIDLQLLGIGVNGHVGFNEPGSRENSRTRIVNLSSETLKINSSQNGVGTPKQALSMGIATIKEARELVMLATGPAKASAVKYLFNHHDDSNCPATFLKSHPHFTLVLDPEAGAKISLKI